MGTGTPRACGRPPPVRSPPRSTPRPGRGSPLHTTSRSLSRPSTTSMPAPHRPAQPTDMPLPGPPAPAAPHMKTILKHQSSDGRDLAKTSRGGNQRLEIIDPRTMEEVHITAPPGVPMAELGAGDPSTLIPEGAETIQVCDDEGGPPPEPTRAMETEFLQSIVEHAVGGADARSPFPDRDHQCYLFSVTSLNDGELRQYDGTLHEVWGVLQRDVAHILRESGLSEDCEAVVMGEDPSFEMLLTA
eukprot:TRINITY_DN5153_c0_g1_i1.p1 TRINITY_DN5153_c0_g1~~TRINITY_DN5153_c0_g1_i1.p1  ORF type:complete len:244 (-),score=46.67 TRINITY_DN5153_c0_g1_i1:142-873(-)